MSALENVKKGDRVLVRIGKIGHKRNTEASVVCVFKELLHGLYRYSVRVNQGQEDERGRTLYVKPEAIKGVIHEN